MDPQLTPLIILLSIFWFLLYWVLGGVFFAVITILRLGRIRMVRFSCLFTLLALALGAGAGFLGIQRSQQAVLVCLAEAQTRAETVVAVFGCGFASIFGVFLAGAGVLTIGGFLIMAISKSKTKPWIILEEPQEETSQEEPTPTEGSSPDSKFFSG
ncbi:hypothetical protein HY631_00900 [Candidatus Uhrbacteria bacterium]|nr:hypothetical protein [Candidatus Uhrbacteria bacterium]